MTLSSWMPFPASYSRYNARSYKSTLVRSMIVSSISNPEKIIEEFDNLFL